MGKRQISKLVKAIKQNPKEKKYPTPGLIPFINKEDDKVASGKEKQLRINVIIPRIVAIIKFVLSLFPNKDATIESKHN